MKVKSTYMTIFRITEIGLIPAGDFVSAADAHEYAREQEFDNYVVLEVHAIDDVEIKTVSTVQPARQLPDTLQAMNEMVERIKAGEDPTEVYKSISETLQGSGSGRKGPLKRSSKTKTDEK